MTGAGGITLNTTKNVQYLDIGEDIMRMLCDSRMEANIKGIQSKYFEFRDKVNAIAESWIKVSGKDYYIFRKEKALIPDTRRMKPTYLGFSGEFLSYRDVVGHCATRESKEIKQKIEEEGFALPTDFEDKLLGLDAGGMDSSLAGRIFRDEECPMVNGDAYIMMEQGICVEHMITNSWLEDCYYSPRRDKCDSSVAKCLAAKISCHIFSDDETLFDVAIRYGIIPDCLDKEDKEKLKLFTLMYKEGVRAGDLSSLKEYILKSGYEQLLGYSFQYDQIREDILREEIDLDGDSVTGASVRRFLDECDYHRARIQKYNPRWYLLDEGKGYWDLWSMGRTPDRQAETEQEEIGQKEAGQKETGQKETGQKKRGQKKREQEAEAEPDTNHYTIHIKGGVIARNPLADVKYDAVVGIDFGTRSTIVAVQDGNDSIIPMRVGMADYLEAPATEHYENPTVMQFIDLDAFRSAYRSGKGRPYTSWDDVKISHEALKNMIDAKESSEYAAFVSDLKQWAGGRYAGQKNGRKVIRDKKGIRYDLKDYSELTDEDIDPIELYAYYLGLFINNMHTGIYLDYLLSFPETYSLETRKHMLSSFRKGIERSLPEGVFEDEDVRAAFRVRQGSSEPAAYAACALEQYGILPTDQGVFYGIFDFGGGTTDFDFGIWKNAPEDEYSYNFIISHFGSGGDKGLGGENLLELLAYNVFIDQEVPAGRACSNLQALREQKIVFYRPPEGMAFPGAEALVSSEESAYLNMKQLMEVLRPVWEEHEIFQKWSQNTGTDGTEEVVVCGNNGSLLLHKDGSVTARVNVFDEKGVNKVQVDLNVNMELVDQTLNARIERGVRNFFEALCEVYGQKGIAGGGPVHIFLAGNSSKSRRVPALFKRYMQEYGRVMFPSGECSPGTEEAGAFAAGHGTAEEEGSGNFLLFPPLGTKEAIELQKQRGIENDENDLMAPTGKTGVAFGMVMCREGSMIRVESEYGKSAQIKFNYYIGINYRRNFKMIFDRTVEYHKWYAFMKAREDMETFEFYYTELPEIAAGDKEIKNDPSIHKRKCLVDQSGDDAWIYFRFVSPSQLEYVVAGREGIGEENYISSIYKVNL